MKEMDGARQEAWIWLTFTSAQLRQQPRKYKSDPPNAEENK